ncbi:MAG: signal peptidase I [Candidatus Pacebacteria bacterium]|nr:signal peptidase I [Candidatus Paceibacterota bacterium]
MGNWFKIIYYAFLTALALIAALLVVSVLPITGNIKFLVVQSGSMTPAIKTGSLVVIKPAGDYKIGDIITFGQITKTKTPTTHRIVEMKVADGNPVYITKGDANNGPDQKEISQKEILGKVLLKVPYIGYAVAAARTKIGFALIIIIPALAIIVEEVIKIKNEIRKDKDKESSQTS